MQVKSDNRTRLADEISIIPSWAWGLAVIGFGAMQFVCNVTLAHDKDAPPAWGRFLLGLLVGVVLAGYLLLLGYVNRDAGRRGMSRLLWTAVAILVPNGLGVILYFILRQPLLSSCPQCGGVVLGGFNFCPTCNHRLSLSCPQCQHVIRGNDVYCANCGCSLGSRATQGGTARSGGIPADVK